MNVVVEIFSNCIWFDTIKSIYDFSCKDTIEVVSSVFA